MKHKLFFSGAVLLAMLNFKVFGVGQPLDPAHSNYVVIGAFAKENNATQFVEDVKKLNFKAISEINPNRNLFYVYVLHTEDKKAAFREANKIRKGTPFSDTWVYTGLLGKESIARGSDLNPSTEKPIVKVEIQDAGPIEAEKKEAEISTLPADTTTVKSSPTEGTQISVPDPEPGGKNFVFKIFTTLDQKQLDGDVDVIDVDRTKKVASFKGNQNVVVRFMSKSGNLSLVCEVFGYRKMQIEINFNKPTDTEGIVAEGNQFIVPFELKRLQKGDLAIMYSVYFFNDAAVMRPESRFEVTSLMDMMNENPRYRIMIHGHTNGGSPGKIISMGESKKFFALEGTKDGFGSAKKLSEERAKVIREFLIAGGIDPKRMEIKAWGGKRPIHDKSSSKARGNVRVEIEILEDK